MEDMKKLFATESWRGRGFTWDERGNSEVVRILISYDKSSIKSIQFVYAEKTGVRYSKVYGEPNVAFNFKAVVFDYPSEYITSVSGKYCWEFGYYKLCSITFGTNYGKYGPFGTPDKNKTDDVTDFTYDFGGLVRAFGGFNGCVCDSCISSIGIYIKLDHTLNSKTLKVNESMKRKEAN